MGERGKKGEGATTEIYYYGGVQGFNTL